MTKTNPERATLLATRRQVLIAGAAAGGALLLPTVPRVAHAATVPFSFECDRQSGFVMDPNQHKRVGFLTDFGGIGLGAPLARDLQVAVPWGGSAAPAYAGLAPSTSSAPGAPLTAKVVGVIEKFSWAGGVGDAIQISAWVSQQNAVQLKALQQTTLKTTAISALGFWIGDYDQETKVWFEQAYPAAPAKVGAQLKPSGLNVDLSPTPVKAGIDVNVYKISLEIVPGANQASTLQFATSSKAKVAKSWGLVVGTLAK